MREIEFRAWDKITGEIKNVSSIYIEDEYVKLFDVDIQGEYTRKLSEVELMQYAGLKDKNGKKIYEGDIIRNAGMRIYEVRWNNKTSSFQCYMNGKINEKFNAIGRVEIIGNIYENPNLLNK